MTVVERGSAGLTIKVDVSIYSEDVVFKCFYWYGDVHEVTIQRTTDGLSWLVRILAKKAPLSEESLRNLEVKVKQDLLDFKTRDIVSKETKLVRELLIAKAFAHTDTFDARPPGEISDPVGFRPDDYREQTQ